MVTAMKSLPPLLASILGLGLLAAGGCGAASAERGAVEEEPGRIKEVLSRAYLVDREYRSMMGPQSTQEIRLLEGEEGGEPELLWITGYEARMVGPDGETPLSQEFMCHSNLDFDPQLHNRLFADAKALTSRLFTLSQGQLEIEFPEGFGIPILSSEPLSLTTQVLNLNPRGEALEVRHKVTVRFARDRDVEGPLKPLFVQGVYGLVALEEAPPAERGRHFGVAGGEEEHGPGCLVGTNAADHEYRDAFGRRFTGHWVVKPGREVNRTLVTHLLNLPFDTTAHYIAVHLHPFAESLELRDRTTGETVFKSHVRPAEKGIGIAHVDYFSSAEGLPLYRDHEYELVSVYHNTTGEDQDSMAVMNLYLLDREFRKPRLEDLNESGRQARAGSVSAGS